MSVDYIDMGLLVHFMVKHHTYIKDTICWRHCNVIDIDVRSGVLNIPFSHD